MAYRDSQQPFYNNNKNYKIKKKKLNEIENITHIYILTYILQLAYPTNYFNSLRILKYKRKNKMNT